MVTERQLSLLVKYTFPGYRGCYTSRKTTFPVSQEEVIVDTYQPICNISVFENTGIFFSKRLAAFDVAKSSDSVLYEF